MKTGELQIEGNMQNSCFKLSWIWSDNNTQFLNKRSPVYSDQCRYCKQGDSPVGWNVIHMNFMLRWFRRSLGALSCHQCTLNVTYFSRETWRANDRFVILSVNLLHADRQVLYSLQSLQSAVCLTFRRCPTDCRIFRASVDRRVTVSIFWSASLPCRHSEGTCPVSVHMCFNVLCCSQARDQ